MENWSLIRPANSNDLIKQQTTARANPTASSTVDRHSGLPSPRSDFDFVAHPDVLRECSVSSILTRDGDQTSPGEARSQLRNDFSHDHMEPRTTTDGKMICTHSQSEPHCANLLFDRKCDWAKHMDKHDRPYKCDDPACIKLRGFTYSGGLLRHRREVHKRGAGNNAFYCPYPYCKRNNGAGFTRKENLKEHMNRVHRPETSTGIDDGTTETPEIDEVRDKSAAPVLSLPTSLTLDQSVAGSGWPLSKRKASVLHEGPLGITQDQVNVREELLRLRRSNEDSSHRIAQLHALLQERDLRILRLEQDVHTLIDQQHGDLQQRMAQEVVAQEE